MICDEGISTLMQWKRQLLDGVDLSSPDGRPLYAYRLNAAQFDSLETVLRDQIQRYSSLSALSESNLSFNALFVLYAAEWWRRRYDGSRWSWEPILADLGASNTDWSASQRNEYIVCGLRSWRLKLVETSGLRYIGSMAVQGGLPMQLLAETEAKGNLARMLRKVLKLAAGGATFQQVRVWIESVSDYLPKSYQREEIYVLLTEVITTVLDLKNEAKLTKSAEAVTQLDQRVPHWRKRFPLPVEDGEVQGLIEQLIRDVIEVQVSRTSSVILAERWLENTDNDIWSICSNIDLSEVLKADDILSLFNIEEGYSLPRSFELVLEVGDSQRTLAARKIAGHETWRIERCPRELKGCLAVAEHRLRLRCPDGRNEIITIRKGEFLDTEMPWIFESVPEQSFRLIRQGSGDVSALEALLVVPADTTIDHDSDSFCKLAAFLEEPEREIYSIRGVVVVKNCLGRRWTIRTGHADAAEESFQWSGDRVWLDFMRPTSAFRGRPRLFLLDGEDGTHPMMDRSVSWGHSCDIAGPIKAFYEEKGELRHQTKMVLLPSDTSVEYQPIDANQGIIHLRHWRLANATSAGAEDTEIQLKHNADTLSLHCTSHQPVAPEWLELELAWEQNSHTAKIRLPFPAEGARGFDATGANLAVDSWLSVQNLAGVRLVSFCRPHIPVKLVFRLRHTKERENEHEVSHRIFPVAGVSRLDIRLQDFAEDIQQLLAADELLDAWVEVSLLINHTCVLSVRVSRYACRLDRLVSDVLITSQYLEHITPEVIETLPVQALRLEHPADEAISLSCIKSQGVATGGWAFNPHERAPGAWLIYPGRESVLTFRPTLWLMAGNSAASTPLANALAIENREERAVTMDRVIATMTADYCDPSWDDLEQLAAHLGHLPLATLDVWRRFVHSPAAMAALAMRMGNLPEDFLRRFSLEQPFLWELVPVQAWLDAARQVKLQSIEWFGEKLAQRQLGEHLNNRVNEITSFCPALGNLLGIVKSIVLEDNGKEITMMRYPTSDDFFRQQLFGREEGALRRLFRDRADDEWLSDSHIYYAIEAIRKKCEITHLFLNESYNFKDTTIGLPILLAIQVSTHCTHEWFEHPERIHMLRRYMAFDLDWFTEAFDLTIARCLSTGIMQH